MAIFLSDLMTNGTVVPHSMAEGDPSVVGGKVRIPNGTILTTSDKILLARFPTGVVFNHFFARIPDLDDDVSPSLTLHAGYDRPVTDPSKAYNATTNPYITDAIGTADTDFFEASSTAGQAGGTINLAAAGFTVTSSPAAAGWVDVSITPAVNATGHPVADVQIEFSIEAYLANQVGTAGEFSGADSINYTTNINL